MKEEWTLTSLKHEAARYHCMDDFKVGSKLAYNVSKSKGLLDEVCQHLPKSKKWTTEQLKSEASKYKTKQSFHFCSHSAYRQAKAKKCLDHICKHMSGSGPAKTWSMYSLRQEVLKYPTRSAFQAGNIKAYKIAQKRGILNDLCSNMEPQRISWTDDMLKEEALKYATRLEFRTKSNSAYTIAARRGILSSICCHWKQKKK